jgi:hypothetical protein
MEAFAERVAILIAEAGMSESEAREHAIQPYLSPPATTTA